MLKVVNSLFNNKESQDYIDFAEKEFNRQFKIDNEIINSYFERMKNQLLGFQILKETMTV